MGKHLNVLTHYFLFFIVCRVDSIEIVAVKTVCHIPQRFAEIINSNKHT